MALIVEVIVTLVFWILLSPLINFEKIGTALYYQVIIDHSLPLACLLIDYSINAVPIIRRHLIGILIYGVIYLLINFSIVKITGYAVYPFLKWNDWSSILISAFLIVFSGITFLLLYLLNTKKLKHFSKTRENDGKILEII